MFEVETDKATLGFEVQDEVFVAKILADEGSPPLPLGAPVAILVDKRDRVDAFKDYNPAQAKPTPKAQAIAEESKTEDKAGKIWLSPSAQNMVGFMHIDPLLIKATGPRGLILKEDVVNFVENSKKTPAKSENKPEVRAEVKVKEEVKGKGKETSAGKVRAPRFSVSSNVRLDRSHGVFEKKMIDPLIIKIAATCCAQVPEANSKFFPDFTRFYDYVDMQVFYYTGGKVRKYFIKDVQSKRIEEIRQALETESTGNYTFAISFTDNVEEIATPTAACLLSIGPEKSQVIKENEIFTTGKYVKVTLNCDHRSVDGAVGANWLKNFKGFAENPLSLI